MPMLVGGKLRVLVLVGDKCVVYHMCVGAAMSLEGVRLPMVTMRAGPKCIGISIPLAGGMLDLRPVWHRACWP
jgi:hypothetical protein